MNTCAHFFLFSAFSKIFPLLDPGALTFTWLDSGLDLTQMTVVRCAIKACNDGHLLLSQNFQDPDNAIMFVIGGFGNAKSSIR